MSRDNFSEIEVLRDPDGIVAVITQRADTSYLSFSLMKEFEREGQVVRTSFLNRRHIAAVKRLLPRVEEYLDHASERSGAAARSSAK
jgi:AraC-like DNA-binding protein